MTMDNTGAHMILELQDDIKKAAKKAAKDWPGVVEAEDLEQEVYLHILERPGTQRDLAEMSGDRQYQTLHKICQRIASSERTSYEVFSGNFRFSVDEVRELLEDGEVPGADLASSWSSGDYTRSGGGHSDPTAAAALSNIRLSEIRERLVTALEELLEDNPRQHEALHRRFVKGETPDHSDIAQFRLIDRALVSLTTRMNRGHKRSHVDRPDGPGTRKAVTNSTARFLSKEGWDADYMPAPAHLRDNHIEPEVWE